MMLVESGLEMGAALLPVLLPGFVAAAIGYVIFIGFGNWGGLHQQSLAVPDLPPYNGTHVYDLIVAVAVGVADRRRDHRRAPRRAGVAGPGLRRLGMPPLLLGGGLAVGLIAQIADWLGADSQDVLFSGQSGVPDLAAADSTKIVLILLVAKALGLRGQPRLRLPRRPGVPGDLHRASRFAVLAVVVVRRLADARPWPSAPPPAWPRARGC